MEVMVLRIGIPHVRHAKLDPQSLFSHQSFLIDILKHVPRRHIGFGTVVEVGLLPIGCQMTLVVKIVRTEYGPRIRHRRSFCVGMERGWPQVGRVPGKTLGCRDPRSRLEGVLGCVGSVRVAY